MATEEWIKRAMVQNKSYEELPPRVRGLLPLSDWNARCKAFCIQNGAQWASSLASTACGEQEYYEDLLRFYRQNYRVRPLDRSPEDPTAMLHMPTFAWGPSLHQRGWQSIRQIHIHTTGTRYVRHPHVNPTPVLAAVPVPFGALHLRGAQSHSIQVRRFVLAVF